MKKSTIKTIGFALLSMTVLAACGNDDAATEGSDKSAEKEFKLGMVTDLGSVNDKSFNQSAWEGLQQLEKDKGFEVKYLEPKADSEVEPSLLQFVNSKTDLTWATSSTLADAVTTIAGNNPDAKLGILDAEVEGIDNVVSVSFKENEGAFLAGVVAASMTETDKIGFVGGMEIPVIQRFHAGFEAGVKAVNPDAQVVVNYVGVFNRVDMGKSAASTMYNDGVDIIFHAAGGTGNGVFNEAQERFDNGEKVWVIGVDKDQSLEFGDDITLTSMMKNVDRAVYEISEKTADGNFPGGEVVRLGLAEDGVGLATTSDKNVPKDVLDLVEDYKTKIISGDIIVPEKP
ncbi:nucleoside-binding protein [Carnobacterium iners]|uniref:Nucleoside-binding protein n=1 Tax=Carnobacterium iners TaxID=1073423 RepID=A0A1X7MZ68_9LACT|nr:BMP family protein [Carnobacterium iners]SEK18903.1 nucleoside-binding protein [Carnobacterium iners]SMH29805.1 nucleoside-binding protein [Carnobacterium iners]